MNTQALTPDQKVQISILSSIIDRSSSYADLIKNSAKKFKRTFGDITKVEFLFDNNLKDLENQGYVSKQDYIGSPIPIVTPKGITLLDSLNDLLKKDVRDRLRYGDRDGVVAMAQKILKNNRVLMAVFLDPSSLYGIEEVPFCKMMMASGKMGENERIFLRLPLVDNIKSFTDDDFCAIKDPNPAFVCVNAFAIFLSVQGTEVFLPRRTKIENHVPSSIDEPKDRHAIETDIYDAINQPKSFTLFESYEIEKVIRESEME